MRQTVTLNRKPAIWIIIISVLLAIMVKVLFTPLATQIQIGIVMNKFAEDKTQPVDIDFSTAVQGETPYLSQYSDKKYPALEKYTIEIIKTSNNILYIAGSNYNESMNSFDHTDHPSILSFVDQNTCAHIFRSTDEGRSFTKIILGRGEVKDIMGYKNHVFAKVYDPIPKRYKYYRSTDNGQTWNPEDWFPIQIWNDGVMFTTDEEGNALRLSMDGGATWRIPSDAFNNFYQVTKPPLFITHNYGRMFDYPPLQKLNDNTVVGMNKDKEILYFDLKTQTTQKQYFNIPDNKNIIGFVVNNNQLGLQIEDYEVTENMGTAKESIKKQIAFYFPETQEYVHFPKYLPAVFELHVQENYIGGIGFINGERVHVYTKNRGKQWYYQVLYSYEPHVPEIWLYTNGYVFSAMHNWSKQGAFIVKLKPL